MNTSIIKFLIICSGLFIFGCVGDFDEMNVNPNTITEVDPSLLLPKMQREAINAGAFAYQRGENLFSNQYCQWTSNSISYFNSDRYEYNSGWVTAAYWTPYYFYVLKNKLDIQKMATTHPEYQEMYHIARIVSALGTARTTDVFGDVPYSEASIGLDKPKYDSQKDIYYNILNELKEATSALAKGFTTEQIKYGKQDLYFQGDVAKWIKFGNSLRLRYALRISFVDPEKAKTEGEAALALPLMSSTADNAYFVTAIVDDGHPMLVISNWGEFRMSSTFEQAYKTLSTVTDPRLELYWGATKKSVDASSPEYKGLRNGLASTKFGEVGNSQDENSNPWGLLWTPEWNSKGQRPSTVTKALPYYVMCYSEVCFLKAEAAIRSWTGAGDAGTNYDAGIKASFDDGRREVDETLYSKENDNLYITTGQVKWLSNADFETKLEKIATQKWIALFPNGTEGWAEVRRTGYPKLTPIETCDDPSIKPANGEFIKKLRYIDKELESNAENSKSSTLNNGKGDGQNVRVWWDTGRYK